MQESAGERAELTTRECLTLLGRCGIGRVIFTDMAMPAVQPVNYVLDGEEVVFHVANGSKLVQAARHVVIGFEVDEVDADTRSGWMVLGVGGAYEVVDPARLAALAFMLPCPWGPGTEVHTIGLPLHLVRGRRLVLHPPAIGSPPRLRPIRDR